MPSMSQQLKDLKLFILADISSFVKPTYILYSVQCREIVVLATYNPVSGTRLEGLSILYIIKGSVKGDKVNSSKCVFSQLFIQ